MRQSSNLRRTPAAARRPVQRFVTDRVMNFGFRAALIASRRDGHRVCSLLTSPNGMPSSRRSAWARSSVPAVVTMVMFMPFDLSTFA